MSIQIKPISSTRFSVVSQFDRRLVNIIQKFEKRFWDAKLKQWTLPMESQDELIKELDVINYNYEVCEKLSDVIIKENGSNLELQFNSYIAEFSAIKMLTRSVYDKERKILTVPKSIEDDVIRVLKSGDIKYSFESTKVQDKQESLKRKRVSAEKLFKPNLVARTTKISKKKVNCKKVKEVVTAPTPIIVEEEEEEEEAEEEQSDDDEEETFEEVLPL